MNSPRSRGLPRVLLMMKAPREGQVKTRLAAEIGHRNATLLYRGFTEHLCRVLFSNAAAPWESVFACTPSDSIDEIQGWLRSIVHERVRFVPQVDGDLGARLEAQFAAAFSEGAPAVLAVGTDCLEISREEVESCLDSLKTHDVVLGEALDGGYWCIGLSGPHFGLFRQMPWSRPDLAATTRARARTLGLRVAERARRRDIDERSDLDRLPEEVRRSAGLDEALWRNPTSAPGSSADQ